MSSSITASDTSTEFEQLNNLTSLSASRLLVLSMGQAHRDPRRADRSARAARIGERA